MMRSLIITVGLHAASAILTWSPHDVSTFEGSTAEIVVDISDVHYSVGVLEATLSGGLAPSKLEGVVVLEALCSNCVRLRGCVECMRAAFAPLLFYAPDDSLSDASNASLHILRVGVDGFDHILNASSRTSETIEIPVVVHAVNHPPFWIAPDLVQVRTEREAVPARIDDPDAKDGSVHVALSVQRGTLIWNASESLAFDGTLLEINAALSTLAYAPVPGDDGIDVLRLEANDRGHRGVGGPREVVREIPLKINAVNRAPFIIAPNTVELEGRGRTHLDFVAIGDANDHDLLDVSVETACGTLEVAAAAGILCGVQLVSGTTTRGRLLNFRTASDTGDALFASLAYEPCARANENDTITITVNDSKLATDKFISVSLLSDEEDDGPITLAATQSVLETREDTPVKLGGALALRGGSSEPRPLNVSLRVTGGRLISFDRRASTTMAGVVVVTGCCNNSVVNALVAQVQYEPANDVHGLAYLTATLGGAQSGEATIALITHAVDDPILISTPNHIDAVAGRSQVIHPHVSVSDVDAPDLQFNVTLATMFGGSLSLPHREGLAVNAATSSSTVHVRGSLVRLNRAFEFLRYARESSGEDRIDVNVRAPRDDTQNGAPRTAASSIDVTVARVNEWNRPIVWALSKSIHCLEDTSCNITSISLDGDSPRGPLTICLAVSHGNLSLRRTDEHDWIVPRISTSQVISHNELVFRAMLPAARYAFEKLVYTPERDWFGADELGINITYQQHGSERLTTNHTSLQLFVENADDPPRIDVTSPLTIDDLTSETLLSSLLSVHDPEARLTDHLLRLDVVASFGRLVLEQPSLTGVSTTWNGIPLGNGGQNLGVVGSAYRLNKALDFATYARPVPGRSYDTLECRIFDVRQASSGLLYLGLSVNATATIHMPLIMNAPPTVSRRDAITGWLYTDERHVLAFPQIEVDDPEAEAFGQVVDINVTSRRAGTTFHLNATGLPLANLAISTSEEQAAATIAFTASPDVASTALGRLSYVAPATFCGVDFLDVGVSDRGLKGDERGGDQISSSRLRLDVRVSSVNRRPEVRVPLDVVATRLGQDVSISQIVFSDFDEQSQGCGDSILNVSATTTAGRLRVKSSTGVHLVSLSNGSRVDARGRPTALTKMFATLTLTDCPRGEHRVDINAMDGAGAEATPQTISVHVGPAFSQSAVVKAISSLPPIMSLPEDTTLPLDGLFEIEGDLPFELVLSVAPGTLSLSRIDDSRRLLQRTSTELNLRGTRDEIAAVISEAAAYVPPSNFNGISQLNATVNTSIAIIYVDIFSVNDPPEILVLEDKIVNHTYGETEILTTAVELRDADADDVLTTEFSVTRGKLVLTDYPLFGIRAEMGFGANALALTGGTDSLNEAISRILFEPTATGCESLRILVRDRAGFEATAIIPIHVDMPVKFATLRLVANATATLGGGYVKIDEDSTLQLGPVFDVKTVVESTKALVLRLEAKHGNVVRTFSASEDDASFDVTFEVTRVGSSSHNATVLRGTAAGLARFVQQSSRLAYVPETNFNGADHLHISLAVESSATTLGTITVNIYVRPVGDSPVIRAADTVKMRYEDRWTNVPVSVHDVDRGDTVDFVARARFGTLMYNSRIVTSSAVRYYTSQEAALDLACTRFSSDAGSTGNIVRIFGAPLAVAELTASLRYSQPRVAHVHDNIHIGAVDSFGRCVNHSVVVDVLPGKVNLRLTTVSPLLQQQQSVLSSIEEDVESARLPALAVVWDGMEANSPVFVNVSIETRFGEIALLEDVGRSLLPSLRVWTRTRMHLGFAATRADVDRALGALAYAPAKDFYGDWEPQAGSHPDHFGGGDLHAGPLYNSETVDVVGRACHLVGLRRRSSLEQLAFRIAPVESAATRADSWTTSLWRVTVRPVNDAPTLTAETDSISLPSGSPWSSVAAMANVSIQDIDAALLEFVATAASGKLRLSKPNGVQILANTGSVVAIRGSAAKLTATIREALQYAPPPPNGDVTDDTLELVARDHGGCGSGPMYSTEFTIQIEIIPPRVMLAYDDKSMRELRVEEDAYLALPAVALKVGGNAVKPGISSIAARNIISRNRCSQGSSQVCRIRGDDTVVNGEYYNNNSSQQQHLDTGTLHLRGVPTHGQLAVYENSSGLDFFEPEVILRLEVSETDEYVEAPRGRPEVWSITTDVAWRRSVQRVTVHVVERDSSHDHIFRSLRATAISTAMTHRNRSSSAAHATLGPSEKNATENIQAALRDLSTIGQTSVAVEQYGVTPLDWMSGKNTTFRATASFLVTFSQNAPVPLLDLAVSGCGGSAADGTVNDDTIISKCTTWVEPVQNATTVPETQRVSIRANGTLESGSFSIVFESEPPNPGQTFRNKRTQFRSAPIAYNASARDVRAALESLPPIGLVDVVRSKYDEPIVLPDDCWCRSCENEDVTNTSAPTPVPTNNATSIVPSFEPSMANNQTSWPTYAPSHVPTPGPTHIPTTSPTAPVVGCNFFPHETAWDITFLTLSHDVAPLVVQWSDGASSDESVCERCSSLRPEWPENIAAIASLSPATRGTITSITNGTTPLAGSFALSLGTKTTSLVSTAATSGQLHSALASLDESLRSPDALAVTRTSPSPEGRVTWRVTFNPRLGKVPRITATSLEELIGTGATVYTKFIARGSNPDDAGGFTLQVKSEAGTAQTQLLAVESTVDDLRHALTAAAAAAAARGGAGSKNAAITVASGPLLFGRVRAAWLITIGAGYGARPEVTIGSANTLRNGLEAALEPIIDGDARASFILAAAAAVPPVVNESQSLRCSIASSMEMLNTFRLIFRGSISPLIRVDAAPNPSGLPSCTPVVKGACKGDGSSLEEIMNLWLFSTGVTDTPAALQVTSSSSSICSRNGQEATTESTIVFVGDGVVGNVPLLVAVTEFNRSLNVSAVDVVETRRGSHPFVPEVQRVQTALEAEENNNAMHDNDYNLSINETRVSGWFALGFRGSATPLLAFDVSPSEMEAALNELPTISGNVRVSRLSRGKGCFAWRVTFQSSPPTQGSLPLVTLASATCEDKASCLKRPKLVGAYVIVEKIVAGVAPAWGSYALRVTQQPPRVPRETVTTWLRLDSPVDEVQAAIRMLPGAFRARATTEVAGNPLAPWGPLLTIRGLDAGTNVEIAKIELEGAVDWCQPNGICSGVWDAVVGRDDDDDDDLASQGYWPGCSACLDVRAPPLPRLRVASLRDEVQVRGAPSAIAAILERSVFVGDQHYHSHMDGLASVSWFVSDASNSSDSVLFDVNIAPVNDPPKLSFPAVVEPVLEDTRTVIGRGIVVFDADDRSASRRQRLTITLSVVHGTLWIPASDELHVLEGYRNGGGAGPFGTLKISGTPAALTHALSSLVYDPDLNWASVPLVTDVQRVTVKGPTRRSVVQTVETSLRGTGLLAGNFSLVLRCGYLDKALEELIAIFLNLNATNTSNYPSIRVSNRAVNFTLASNAPAVVPSNISFQGKLQRALDECSAIAIDEARSAGLQFGENISIAYRYTRVEASAWRSSRRERDHSYLWEVTFLNAPATTFPDLVVVVVGESGEPVGLAVTDVFDGNLTFPKSRDARASVQVKRVRDAYDAKEQHWLTLRHTCSGFTATTTPLPLDASAPNLADALMSLSSVGSVQVRAVDSAVRRSLDGVYAWEIEFLPHGNPAHVGSETPLEVVASDGVEVTVEKLRQGRATHDELKWEIQDEDGLSAAHTIPVTVRPVHDAPEIRVMSATGSDLARGFEDETLRNLFQNIVFSVDGNGIPAEKIVATSVVTCVRACTVTIPPVVGAANNLGAWRRDIADEVRRNAALVLHGAPRALEALLRVAMWDPEPDFYGVDVATVMLIDTLGTEAIPRTRTIRVEAVNDPPNIRATFRSLPLKVTLIAGLIIGDPDDTMLTLSMACEYGFLRLRRQSRRTIAHWIRGDDEDEGARLIEAKGLVSAWNDALHYLEYSSPTNQRSDAVNATVVDSAGAVASLSLPVRLRAASCQHLMNFSVGDPLKKVVAGSAEAAARTAIREARDENGARSVVTEGTTLSLEGLQLAVACTEASTLRVQIAPHSVDDSDGPGEGADATLSVDARYHGIVQVDASRRGLIALTSPGPSTTAAATQLTDAFSYVTYRPPLDYNGLARLVVSVEALGEATGAAEYEMWLRIEAVDDPPELRAFGPAVVAAATSVTASLTLQAVARAVPDIRTPSETDAWMLADQAVASLAFFQHKGGGGGVIVSNDGDDLLTVSIDVAWASEYLDATNATDAALARDGSRLAVSLEPGCASGACGALHFVERLGATRGKVTSSHSSLRFLASPENANRAFGALRVVALGDYEACWRSNAVENIPGITQDGARKATLTIIAVDAGGQSARRTFNLRVIAPPFSPLEIDGDVQVLRSIEDGSSLLRGLRLRDGRAVVSGRCAQDEIVELRVRARRGTVTAAAANLDAIGVSSERRGDEVIFSGPRSAMSQLFGSHDVADSS